MSLLFWAENYWLFSTPSLLFTVLHSGLTALYFTGLQTLIHWCVISFNTCEKLIRLYFYTNSKLYFLLKTDFAGLYFNSWHNYDILWFNIVLSNIQMSRYASRSRVMRVLYRLDTGLFFAFTLERQGFYFHVEYYLKCMHFFHQ